MCHKSVPAEVLSVLPGKGDSTHAVMRSGIGRGTNWTADENNGLCKKKDL